MFDSLGNIVNFKVVKKDIKLSVGVRNETQKGAKKQIYMYLKNAYKMDLMIDEDVQRSCRFINYIIYLLKIDRIIAWLPCFPYPCSKHNLIEGYSC